MGKTKKEYKFQGS